MTLLGLLKFALSEPKQCFEQSDMIHILEQLTSHTVLRKKKSGNTEMEKNRRL